MLFLDMTEEQRAAVRMLIAMHPTRMQFKSVISGEWIEVKHEEHWRFTSGEFNRCWRLKPHD